jgi:hypothetical protein
MIPPDRRRIWRVRFSFWVRIPAAQPDNDVGLDDRSAYSVMAGLGAAIHDFARGTGPQIVDARPKAGHDELICEILKGAKPKSDRARPRRG